MRDPERDKGRIEDMIEASNNVINFVDGLSFNVFSNDKLRYYAVLKNVEIIGEAAYMLTKDFRDRVNSIPWDAVIKMRHILVHGYASVLPEILWDTAINDVPWLKRELDKLLDEFPK